MEKVENVWQLQIASYLNLMLRYWYFQMQPPSWHSAPLLQPGTSSLGGQSSVRARVKFFVPSLWRLVKKQPVCIAPLSAVSEPLGGSAVRARVHIKDGGGLTLFLGGCHKPGHDLLIFDTLRATAVPKRRQEKNELEDASALEIVDYRCVSINLCENLQPEGAKAQSSIPAPARRADASCPSPACEFAFAAFVLQGHQRNKAAPRWQPRNRKGTSYRSTPALRTSLMFFPPRREEMNPARPYFKWFRVCTHAQLNMKHSQLLHTTGSDLNSTKHSPEIIPNW